MAIQYLGSNKVTKCGNGTFETDPSGWGIALEPGPSGYTQQTRTLEEKQEGAHSCRFRATNQPNVNTSRLSLLFFQVFGLQNGKTYEFSIHVKSLSNNPITPDQNKIAMFPSPVTDQNFTGLVILEKNEITVVEAGNVWTKIFARVRKDGDYAGFGTFFDLSLTSVGNVLLNVGGDLFVDRATVFEYVEVADPDPEPDPGNPDPEPIDNIKDIFFYHNPITLNLSGSVENIAKENFQIVNTVEVNESLTGDAYKPALSMELEPATGGIAEFYANAAFRGYLNPVPPAAIENSIVRKKDRLLRFRYKHGEVYEDLVEPLTTTKKGDYLVLLGGISKEQYPNLDFFNVYLAETKKFLTWQPETKRIDRLQEEFLTFLVWSSDPAYTAPTTINLKVKVYFTDNTTVEQVTRSIANPNLGWLLQVPAGFINAGVFNVDPEKNVEKYEVWLENQSSVALSEVRNYTLEANIHPYTRYFIFLNSLGGYDTVRTTGITSKSAKIQREEFERLLPSDYSLQTGQFATYDTDFQNDFDVSTGHVTKRYADYLQDMLISKDVYEVVKGKRVPVLITNTSVVLDTKKQNRWFVRFDIRAAFKNKVYTPDL